jgi:hypothetical protein
VLRWRRIALATAACTVVAALILVAGLAQLHERSQARSQARNPDFVEEVDAAERAPLRIVRAMDSYDGRQWDVSWVEPAPGAPTPPGLARWPAPGEFAVSPGLDDAIDRIPALARRYRDRTVIGDAGVADRGEWFAYARSPDGRSLGAAGDAFSGFGHGPAPAETERNGTLVVVVSILSAVLLPALLVLLAGLSAATPELDRRAVLLHRLGVPRSHLRRVSALEALMGVTPGAVLGVVAGVMVAGRIERIPFTDLSPVPGDLVVPWLEAAAVASVVVAVAACWAALRGGRNLDGAGPRPAARSRLHPVVLLPLVAGIASLALAVLTERSAGSPKPSAAATLLLLVGVPLALPFFAAAGGRWLASGSTVVRLLAGRRIDADPTGSVRPLLGLAALVFLILTAFGYVSAVRPNDPPPVLDAELDAAAVLYAEPQPADLDALRSALPGTVVAPMDGTVIDVGCDALDRLLPAPCTASGALTRPAQLRIGRLLGQGAQEAQDLRLGTLPAPDRPSARALVIGPRGSLTTRVQIATGQHLVAPWVTSVDSDRPRTSPLWGWILLGLSCAAALLAVAATLAVADGALRSASSHGVLSRLGVGSSTLARLEVAQFGVAYAATVGVTLAFGIANAWIMIRTAPTAAVPVAAFCGLAAATVVVGIVGALAVRLGFDRRR